MQYKPSPRIRRNDPIPINNIYLTVFKLYENQFCHVMREIDKTTNAIDEFS